MGVAPEGETQIVLVDTPGVFAPTRRLDRAMVQAAGGGAQDADLIALFVHGRGGLGPKMDLILDGFAKRKEPKWLILKKVDIATKEKLLVLAERLQRADGVSETLVRQRPNRGRPARAQDSGWLRATPVRRGISPSDQVSDITDRLLAAEITREQLDHQLH